MKKLLLVFTLMLTVAVGSTSATPTDVAPEVRANIIKILNAGKSKEAMIATMSATYDAMSGQLGMSKAETKEMATFVVNRVYPLMQEKFIELWNSQFTPQEIKDIAAFYETPAGRKMGEKTPLLGTEGVKIGTSYATEIQNAVMEFMQKRK